MKKELRDKKSHRTTISVPKEVKERMAKYDHLVNWSAVASNAFTKIMDEIDNGEVKVTERMKSLLETHLGGRYAEAIKGPEGVKQDKTEPQGQG